MLLRSRLYFSIIVDAILFASLVFLPQAAYAATYTVTNLDDDGPGSLRAAINAANGTAANDVINFSISGTITLTTGGLPIANNGSLTIDGGGNISVSSNAGSSFGVFGLAAGANTTLNGLTITGGAATQPSGAAIDIGTGGTLNLNDSTVTDNHGYYYGAIYNRGTLIITDSLISDNSADISNSGSRGGGIFAATTLTAAAAVSLAATCISPTARSPVTLPTTAAVSTPTPAR